MSIKTKKRIALSDAQHPKRQKAIRIIEEVVEPLMGLMATNIRANKKATIKSILKELERGMENEAYYEMEDAIVKILK